MLKTTHLEIVLNGKPRQLSEGATLADLLAELNLQPAYVAVEVNMELVPRGRHSQHVLREGDRLEVVTLVGGG